MTSQKKENLKIEKSDAIDLIFHVDLNQTTFFELCRSTLLKTSNTEKNGLVFVYGSLLAGLCSEKLVSDDDLFELFRRGKISWCYEKLVGVFPPRILS